MRRAPALPSARSRTATDGGSPATAVPNQRDAAARVAEKSTTVLFVGYLVLILVEYCGLARNLLPFLLAIRFSTVLAYLLLLVILVRVGVGDLFQHRQTRILAIFIVFTAASVLWAVVQTYAFQAIRPMVDHTVFFVLTLTLVDRQRRIDALSWAFVAVSAYVIARNLDKLGSATRTGVMVGGSFMGDGNDFAWAMTVMLPIILNLMFGQRSWLERCGGLLGAGLCVIGIVGTSSRGAALAAAAMGLYYLFALARRRTFTAVALAGIVGAVLVLAPSHYGERLGSIAEYEEDNSAQARLQTWGAAIRMAVDYPLGVGADNFSSAYGRFYVPESDDNRIGWGSGRWLSAHSIYFRTLGEYGVLGLGLLVWLIIGNVRDNVAVRKALTANPELAPVSPMWPGLLAMAVIGHAVGGVFLGGLPYLHLFLLAGLTVANKRLVASVTGPPPPRAGVRKSIHQKSP